MKTPISNIEAINLGYYDKLYAKKNLLQLFFHPLISFDQQSKSKRNFLLFDPILKSWSKTSSHLPLVLDYGFGHGSFLLKLPRSCLVFGCDLSAEAVDSLNALCKLLRRSMELFTVNEFESKTANLNFDWISCSHVLEHVPDDIETLRLITSKLSSQGKILVNLPINEVWEDPKHLRKYNTESIHILFEKAGLHIESMQECDRWTAFFLHFEMVKPLPRLVQPCLRVLRLLFAIIPLGTVDTLESIFIRKYPAQQILVLGSIKKK